MFSRQIRQASFPAHCCPLYSQVAPSFPYGFQRRRVGRYKGSTLFDLLDSTDPLPRDPLGPFRMSVIDKYKDMGTIAMGKSEAGIVRKGDRLYIMPNK